MTFRKTKKYEQQCRMLKAARAEKERRRLSNAEPRHDPLPDKRITITVTRHDTGNETHTFELYKGRRVDMYRVYVDGNPWKHCGLSAVLEGIRKSMPRILAEFT
jgi:hypothetical protein